MKMRKIVGSLLFLIGLIAVWQLLYVAATDWLEWAKPYAVPHPLGVAGSIGTLLANGTLAAAVAKSMMRVLIGFFISLVIGVLFGILIIQSDYFARNLKPLLLGVQTLPSICWVPFAILWFGLNESAIIFVVVMGSVFSISLAVESGIKEVPPIYIKAAKTMGVTPAHMYTKVIFPAALPSFVAGMVVCLAGINVRRSDVGVGRPWLYADDRARSCGYQSGNDGYACDYSDWYRNR